MTAILYLLIALAFGVSATRWSRLRLNVFEFTAAAIVVGTFAFTWIMLLPSIVLPYAASLPLGVLITIALGVLLWVRGEWTGFERLTRCVTIAWSVIAILSLVFWLTLSWTHDLDPVNGTLMSVGSTWADFGLHANIATHQAYTNSLPGDLPIASGTNMTYPFLIDFLSALFLKGGWSLHMALTIPGTLLTWAITQLLVGFGRRLYGSFAGAVTGVVLTLCGGSFIGITLAWHSYRTSGKSLFHWLGNVPDNFAGSWAHNAPFFSPVGDLLLPQRAFLFGLGVWLVIVTLWHRSLVGATDTSVWNPFAGYGLGGPRARGTVTGTGSSGSKASEGGGSKPGSKSGAKAAGGKSGAAKAAKSGTGKSPVRARVATAERPATSLVAEVSDDSIGLDATGKRSLFAAAVLFGLMPMAHAHSFVAAAFLFAGLLVWMLVYRRFEWKTWGLATAVSVVIAIPQLAWQQFAVSNGTGGHVTHGWVRAEGDPILSFEWRNFGFFLIVMLALIVLLARSSWRRYRPWLIPFLVLFVFAQFYSLQPLAYDNLKLFFYVYLMSMLALGALIMKIRLPRSFGSGSAASLSARALAALVAFGCLGVGGAVTIAREYQLHYQFASADDLSLAAWVKANTPISAIFAGTPSTGESPGTVAGRNLLMAYSGWLYNYNLDSTGRQAAISALLKGDVTDPNVLKYKPDYLMVSAYETAGTTDPAALAKLNLVYHNATWSVYKLR